MCALVLTVISSMVWSVNKMSLYRCGLSILKQGNVLKRGNAFLSN